MRGTGKVMAGLAAVFLATSLVPGGSANVLTTEQMLAEINALQTQFQANSPDFWAALRNSGIVLPDSVLTMPILNPSEAQAYSRDLVIYSTPAAEYADFVVDLYNFYKVYGALGIESLQALPGEEIAKMVEQGLLPSHAAYKKFNLLSFYASLRDPENEQWLLEQPKTNARAQQRIQEVLNGITPEMRADAGQLLGEAMAVAYTDILAQMANTVSGLSTDAHSVPLPPTPPLPALPGAPAVPSVSDVRGKLQGVEQQLVDQAKYTLKGVLPLVSDVKLTVMNELTLVLQELTSITKVFTKLEQYYYEYNYYYHYEFLQHFWYLWDYRVDHIEQVDRVQYYLFTQDTYELIEYLYHYTDLINIRGLVSGVLALDYEKVVPPQVQNLPGQAMLSELNHPPEEVQILLDFLMPFSFDITDELSLYFLQELINNVLNYFKSEYHFYWEYHIRNYWRWDPLNSENLPFANAALSTATDYIVSVSEDLDVGKVLNVIPVGNLYREASISLFAPLAEYPLLDKATYLQPAPVSFLTDQVATGATAQKLTEYLHVGPAPNTAEVYGNAQRLTDKLVATADEQEAQLLDAYTNIVNLLGASYGNPAALYTLIPDEVRVNMPTVGAPTVAVPSHVDTGVDAYQMVVWDSKALPSFVPQFAFAGVRAVDSVDQGRPLVVSVSARGLGSPVTFVLDLNQALQERAQTVVDGVKSGSFGGFSLPGTGVEQTVPAAAPWLEWAESSTNWGAGLVAWLGEKL